MENLEHKIPPPVLVFIMGILTWAIAQFFPSTANAVAWRYPLIIIFSCIGLVFAVPAFIAFWRAKTTINPVNIQAASTLVTTGIYQYTRNQMYVGLTALLLAWWAFLSIAWLVIGHTITHKSEKLDFKPDSLLSKRLN